MKYKVWIQFKYYCPVQCVPIFITPPKFVWSKLPKQSDFTTILFFIICYYILHAQISITNWFERPGCFLCCSLWLPLLKSGRWKSVNSMSGKTVAGYKREKNNNNNNNNNNSSSSSNNNNNSSSSSSSSSSNNNNNSSSSNNNNNLKKKTTAINQHQHRKLPLFKSSTGKSVNSHHLSCSPSTKEQQQFKWKQQWQLKLLLFPNPLATGSGLNVSECQLRTRLIKTPTSV